MQRQPGAEDGEGPGAAGEVVAAGQVDEAVGAVQPEGLGVGIGRGEQGHRVRQALDERVQQLPAEALALVDGFITYLGQVLTAAVPEASWRTGQHRISDNPMRNRPVLAGHHHQVFLPALPLYSAYQTAHGRDPMSGAEMLAHVRRTISALRGEGPEADTAEEPLVTVVAEVDCFDVGLRADIAEHPSLVDRLVEELVERDGVESVHRYGPAALVVNAPSWEELRLQMWLTLWLQRNLPR